MISIIRLKSQERRERICDLVIASLDDLQKRLKDKGQLLYLTKRARHEDVSLFVHTFDPNFLGDFISEGLARVEHVTDIWVINLIKPIFYPLTRDTKDMRRFAISLKVFTKGLKDVYRSIADAALPGDLKLAYLAYTFHLFEDSLQFSLLTRNEDSLQGFITGTVEKIPGVLRTTVNPIERTRSLVSYDMWREYSSRHGIVPTWDERSMIGQFQG